MNQVKARDINKKESSMHLNNRDFDLLQQYVILRTYLAFPIRNDFADMKIVNLREYKKYRKTQF